MNGRSCAVLAGLAVLVAGVVPAVGYKEVPPPAKVVLPKALSPAESLAAIAVPDDLTVELVAAEPTVLDPIDLAWDAAGRLWVVEMADYPQGMDGKGKAGGRIRVLESTRGDGVYDKATLFADGLRTPTSVRPWGRGVLTVTVPDLVLLEDTDGDGRADRREVLFTGLAEGNEQHLANGLQWGLDGWLYLANGNSGGKIASARGGPVLDVGQRDFRVSIATGAVEVLAGRSQTGLNRDDWDNWFGGNNSNPIWHYALEDRYLRRNPHFVPPAATVPVSAVPGAARIYPRSETLARFNDPHGFNHFTSACGTMLYRDDALGAGYAGNVFVCEPVHNLVHREVLRPAGATFRSERAASEREAEFMASKDPWSRFVAVRAGPDGALYVADMYRLVVEHPKWIPDAWQKELGNVRAGEDKGRIYRVRRKGTPLRTVPRLDRADAAGLVAALGSPSGTVRDLAQQELVQRGAALEAEAALTRAVRGAASAETRAQALWTLQLRGTLSVDLVRAALGDGHAGVRRQAVRLSEPWLARGQGDLSAAVLRLAGDPDAGVRQQVAYALGELPPGAGAEAGAALARLLRSEEDKFVRAAAMSSALPQASTVLAAVRAAGRGDDPVLLELATATANAQALAGILVDLGAAVGTAGAERLRQFRTLGQLLDFLQRGGKSLGQLPASPEIKTEAALAAAERVLAAARAVAVDTRAPDEDRAAAVTLLGRGRSQQAEDLELLARLLAPQTPVEVQVAAVASVARLNRPTVPEKLLAGWAGHGPKVRAAVLDALLTRAAWAQALLDWLEKDRTRAAQIDATHRVALTQHANAKLAERASALLLAGVDADRAKVVARYTEALATRRGDGGKGAGVFAAACAACHRFGPAVGGGAIGPDLATVKDRSAPYLLTHILDPNRAVEDRYLLYTATLNDGRTVVGTLAGEAGGSLTLRGLDGVEQAVLRQDVRSLVSTTRSLMPEGLEAAIDEQAMADLVTFLAGRLP